jgi:hypothetical protein
MRFALKSLQLTMGDEPGPPASALRACAGLYGKSSLACSSASYDNLNCYPSVRVEPSPKSTEFLLSAEYVYGAAEGV